MVLFISTASTANRKPSHRNVFTEINLDKDVADVFLYYDE